MLTPYVLGAPTLEFAVNSTVVPFSVVLLAVIVKVPFKLAMFAQVTPSLLQSTLAWSVMVILSPTTKDCVVLVVNNFTLLGDTSKPSSDKTISVNCMDSEAILI